MLYAKVVSGAVVESRDFETPPPDMTRKGFKWLPYVDTNPVYDSATQIKTGPVITVNTNDVTRVWTMRAMTTPELDAIKDSRVSNIDFLQFELAFDHENRIRVLEAKAPITRAVFINALKARLP
jgi:hypothetical protein